MNKLFTKITSLALGAAMMIGVGVSVGSKSVGKAYADTKNITPSTVDGTDDIWSWNSEQSTGSSAPTMNSGAIRLYPKNTFCVSTTSGTVSKIDSIVYSVTVNANKSGKIPGEPTSSDGTVSVSGTWSGSQNVTVTIDSTGSTCKSVTFIVGTGQSAGNIHVNSFTITYTTAGSDPIKGTLAISDPGSIVEGHSGTFSYSLTNGTQSSLSSQTWSSSNSSVINITDATTGAYTAAGQGSATITLTGTDASGFSYTTNVDGGAATRSVTVAADPFASFTKVTSTSSMSETDVYAFGDENKQYFAANTISNKALQIVTTLTNIGYFAINSDGNIVPCTKNGDVYTMETDAFLNNNSGTDLALETEGSSAWEGVDYSGAVILENTSNSNRYLGFNSNGSSLSAATGIKAYALSSGDPQANYPFVCLYKVGELAGIQYSVTYDSNATGTSGATVDSNSPYDKGSDVTVLANGFTYAGHSFAGWNTADDGTGTTYQPNATISSISANVTLYAQWEEVDYIAVKSAKVTISSNATFDLTSNLTIYGPGTLTISPMSTDYYSITGTTLTPTAVTTSDLTITFTKGNLTPVSYNIAIIESHAGTEDDPFTVEEALAKIDEVGTTGTSQAYYVGGYITEDPTFSSKRGRAYLGDTTDATDTLYAYGFNGFNNVADLETGAIVAGDYIVVRGQLKLYGETPELCFATGMNCYLVGIDPVDPTVVTIDVSEKSLFVGDSYTFTVSSSAREYLEDSISYSFKDSTIGDDYTWTEASTTFKAGNTKGSITLVATSNFDEEATAECVINISKKLVPPSGEGSYQKVTKLDDIVTGTYLIVSEDNGVAFDGSLSTLDAVSNTIDVTATDGVIASSETVNAATFEITKSGTTYSVQSNSGFYIGNTSDANALKTSADTAYENTISISDGDVEIVCSDSHLRYNSASNQARFRYYKSSSYTNQQTVQLYKWVEGSTVDAKVYFCQQVLEFLECDETGVNRPSTSEWGQLGDLFDDLTSEEKLALKQATAAAYDDELPEDPDDSDYIAFGLAKYDYVIAKYGHLEDSEHNKLYENFIERTVTPLPGSGRILIDSLFGSSNSTATTVIIIISVIGVSALGGFFFLRKRKEI